MLAFQTESGYIFEAKSPFVSVICDKCYRRSLTKERNLITSLNLFLSTHKSVVQEKRGEESK